MKYWIWIMGVAVLQFKIATVAAQACVFSTGTFAAGGSYSGSCGLTVGSNITINGSVTWTSGTLQLLGSAGNITIANGGSLTITAGGVEAIDDGNTDGTNDGRIVVNSGGTLTIASGASITSYAFMTVNGSMQINGTCTLQNGRLDIGSTGQLHVGNTGLLDVNGTGDNIISGLVTIWGRLETNGDIDVNGGSLEIDSQGEIVATGTDIDLDVYNGGSVWLEDGGSVNVNGDVNNTDSDGCSIPTCTPGGEFDIGGTLIVGGDVTILDTSPESGFISTTGSTGEITINGTFYDNECDSDSYGADVYHYCDCNGQSGTSCSAALPIEIISFSGQQIGNSVMLHWTTASETTNDFFSVERLTDADSFIEVGKINGAGTSYAEINYEALDRAPEPGRNYYRLKQTDFDKTITYSSLIAVEYEALDMELGVYPNPCSVGSIVISSKRLAPNQTIHIALKNNQGVNFFSGTWQADAAGNLQKELDVSSLAEGMYIVQAGPLTAKVIISK